MRNTNLSKSLFYWVLFHLKILCKSKNASQFETHFDKIRLTVRRIKNRGSAVRRSLASSRKRRGYAPATRKNVGPSVVAR